MGHCLYCHEALETTVSWKTLLYKGPATYSCDLCKEELILIRDNYCQYCRKETTSTSCDDCIKWHAFYSGEDPLQKNISIYYYNHRMKEIISRWKYRGDYELGKLFQARMHKTFLKEFSAMKQNVSIVPIPLSEKRLMERNFNQAYQLASFLSNDITDALKRVHTEKQSKKSRKERLMTKNPFILTEKVKEKVILVDDIYTTGQTVRHAASLLKKSGCTEIYAFTLIRG